MPEKTDMAKKEQDRKPEQKIDPRPDPKTDPETQKLLEMSEISIWLDNYDDIFSDFDPRPFSKRSLSDDFLNEAKKASREKSDEKLELRLLHPDAKRDIKEEANIKKRLRDHFSRHAKMLEDEIKASKTKGIKMFFLGISLILGATSVESFLHGGFLSQLLFVILEPSGWFVTWYALEQIFYPGKDKAAEYLFYKKMSKCEIMFSSY